MYVPATMLLSQMNGGQHICLHRMCQRHPMSDDNASLVEHGHPQRQVSSEHYRE